MILDASIPPFWTVENVLSPEECTALIARIEAAGPELAPINGIGGFVIATELRNNTRVIFDDEPLAARLFERVRPSLPPTLDGQWQLLGANERLRCYRYAAGEYFGPHLDGWFARSANERSHLTFMVYLNGDFEGGDTNFLEVGASVRPAAGRALLFGHRQLHEGAAVERGVKYVVRSDILYRRAPANR